MTIRLPEHLCMLCLLRKAVKTGSHFVPAGILKPVIGKRDHEEAHSIDPLDVSTSSFFGRSNLKNTDPQQKPNLHVADYIFCNECEDYLAKIESEIIPLLEKTIPPSNTANVRDEKINDSITLRICQKIPSTLFNIFVYSLVWRIAIQQRLDHHTKVVSNRFDEDLRNILNNNIDKGVEELRKTQIDFDYDYSIITCDDIGDATATYINPGVELSNPQLFYIGVYLVLIHHKESAENAKVSTLPPEVLDKRFRNGAEKEPIKVLKVSREVWDEVNLVMVEYAHKTYSEKMVVSLAESKQISLQQAANILQQKVEELGPGLDPSVFFKELNEFYQQQME